MVFSFNVFFTHVRFSSSWSQDPKLELEKSEAARREAEARASSAEAATQDAQASSSRNNHTLLSELQAERGKSARLVELTSDAHALADWHRTMRKCEAEPPPTAKRRLKCLRSALDQELR